MVWDQAMKDMNALIAKLKPKLKEWSERFSRLKAEKPKADDAYDYNDQITVNFNHSAVHLNDPYSFHSTHKRTAWLLRLMTFGFVASIILNIMLASMFSALMPLKEIRVALLRVHPEDSRIYQVEPINKRVPGFKLLLEQKAREFVTNMLAIDPVTQKERLQFGLRLASSEYSNQYIRDFVDGGLIKKVMDAGLIRDIRILSAEHLRSFTNNTYKLAVHFDQIDLDQGEAVEVKELIAYLSMTTRPQTVTEAEKYENPLGIRILDMAIKFRGNEPQDNQE